VPEILIPGLPLSLDTAIRVLIRLVAACLLGYVVALIYRRTRPPAAVLASFPGTLVLLSVLIAMVTQVIGDNVARAFSLVGALSIVRFRTVVRDTQDTAYVIFAVAVGMSVGADHPGVALAGLGVIGVAAFLMRPRDSLRSTPDMPCHVDLRIALAMKPATVVTPVLETYLRDVQMRGVSTARQGLALDVSFSGVLPAGCDASELVKSLNRLEGVQEVALKPAEPRDT
jgi:hypothetical protein